MKKHITLYVSVLIFSFANAQYLEDKVAAIDGEFANETYVDASFLSLSNDGKIVEHLNGKTLFEAHIKSKKLNGRWQSWYENGLLCDSGTFVKGLPDGEWKHWDADGRIVALRTYSADKYKRVSNELVRYNPRRVSYALTVLYSKNRKAALKYLRATYSFTGGKRNKDGLSYSQLIAANVTPGNFYQPIFDHSLHHGLYVNYFVNGMAKDSGYYKNGLRQGLWIHRESPNGVVQSGVYDHGTKTKGWRTYDQHGKLMSMTYYSARGRVNWKKSFQ